MYLSDYCVIHIRRLISKQKHDCAPSVIRVSVCAQWLAKDPSFLHADSEGSDQTGGMPRLI